MAMLVPPVLLVLTVAAQTVSRDPARQEQRDGGPERQQLGDHVSFTPSSCFEPSISSGVPWIGQAGTPTVNHFFVVRIW